MNRMSKISLNVKDMCNIWKIKKYLQKGRGNRKDNQRINFKSPTSNKYVSKRKTMIKDITQMIFSIFYALMIFMHVSLMKNKQLTPAITS